MPRPVAVVVDPMSSGSFLAPAFAEHGWDSVAVVTARTMHERFLAGVHPEQFLEVIEADEALDRLSRYEVSAVVPGTETGVEFADVLADCLGVPGNVLKQSHARRNKAAQGERLHECGIPAAAQVATNRESTLVDWALRRGTWPVVVKPTNSAASDGFHVCADESEVRAAFHDLFGKVNLLGVANETLLGQEFLAGQQYLVNTVSVDGAHYVGELWRFDNFYLDTHQVYDKQELLAPFGEPQDTLVAYAFMVLDALGVQHGAAHTEIMMTEAGPRLIEVAARMTGLIGQKTLMKALGHHHISLTVACDAAPEEILDRMPRYQLNTAVQIVALRSDVDGFLRDGSQIEALPTFSEICGGTLEAGRSVSRSVDLFSSPGLVYLLGDTHDEVARDLAAIRELEAGGELYVNRG